MQAFKQEIHFLTPTFPKYLHVYSSRSEVSASLLIILFYYCEFHCQSLDFGDVEEYLAVCQLIIISSPYS